MVRRAKRDSHGLCSAHSCSVVIMENADPTAQHDLEEFFDRLVPEDADYFTHGSEGSDDMPSHIRMALTRTSEAVPIIDGKMQLGTWQGIFLFEHRRAPHRRKVSITIIGEWSVADARPLKRCYARRSVADHKWRPRAAMIFH